MRSWVNFDGQTPFVRAALSGDIEVMRLLLEAGADPKIATTHGTTALMAAAGINWIPGQTYSHTRGRLRRGREAVPGARRRRERLQLARIHRDAWRRQPRMGVGHPDPRRSRRQARREGRQVGRTPMTFAEGIFLAVRPPVAKPERHRVVEAADEQRRATPASQP